MRTRARHRARDILRKLQKLALIGREPAYRSGLRRGVAAAIEHEQVPFGQVFRSVVDVGAGRGQFALVAARRFPQARLHCFEPVSEARETLAAVAGGLADIRIYDLALGSTVRAAEVRVAGNLDSSSLLPMTASHLSAYPGTAEKRRVTVPLARLDGVLTPNDVPPPSLLKIDVQGYELEVLRGAAGLLNCFAAILVECSFMELYAGQARADDIVAYLGQQGFGFAGVFSITRDELGRCLQADFLFEHQMTVGAAARRGPLAEL